MNPSLCIRNPPQLYGEDSFLMVPDCLKLCVNSYFCGQIALYGRLSCLVWSCWGGSCLVWSCVISPWPALCCIILSCVILSCLVLFCLDVYCLALSCGRVFSCAHSLWPAYHSLSIHSLEVVNMAMPLQDVGPASGRTLPPTERYVLIFYCCMICTINIHTFIHPSLIWITIFSCLFGKWDTAGLYHWPHPRRQKSTFMFVHSWNG